MAKAHKFTTHGWYDIEGNYLEDQKGAQYWYISNKEHWLSIFKGINVNID